MENTELLTDIERGWVRYHLMLATTRDYDFAEFTKLFMQEIIPIKYAEPIKTTPRNVSKHTKWCECPTCETGGDFDHDMSVIKKFNAEADRKRMKELAEIKREEAKTARYNTERVELLKYCRKMTEAEYKSIQRRFRHTEGFPQYGTGRDWFYLVAQPGYIPELYGANSVNLFIPAIFENMRIDRTFHGKSGHNNLYFSNGKYIV